MSTGYKFMDYVTNYPLYRVLHNKEQFDVRNIVSEHLEVGDVTRVLQEPGGLGDHQLVWVGERHPVLRDKLISLSSIISDSHYVSLNPSLVEHLLGPEPVLLQTIHWTHHLG